MKYYLDDIDFIWAEQDGKIYSYNYKNKTFELTDERIDIMKWHEFPENELEEAIKIQEHLFK
jgi:hypothetical protein